MGSRTNETGRIYLYDNVRFVLICLVVIGHCIGPYIDQAVIYRDLHMFIYSFHMPAFVFLAGMFHKNERIIPKAVSYICIGMLMKFGTFAGNYLLGETGSISFFTEGWIPWFVFALAGYTAASYLMRDMDKRFLLLAACVFGCFSGYDQTINDFLSMNRGFTFYPFYVLGQMCDSERLAGLSRKRGLRLAGGIALVTWAALCFTGGPHLRALQLRLVGPYPEEYYSLGAFCRLADYGIAALMCFSLPAVLPARKLPIVSTLGSRTLQIYFWHWVAVRIIAATGLDALLCASSPGRGVWSLLGIAVTILVGTRPFSFPTEYILYYTGVRRKRPLLLPKEKTGLS